MDLLFIRPSATQRLICSASTGPYSLPSDPIILYIGDFEVADTMEDSAQPVKTSLTATADFVVSWPCPRTPFGLRFSKRTNPKGCTDVSQGWSEATPLARAYMNQSTSKRCEANLASCAWRGRAHTPRQFAKEFPTRPARIRRSRSPGLRS